MKSIRQSTAARTRLISLPEAFVTATVATAARTTYRNRVTPGDARRAADKMTRVLAILATLALEACGGRVAEEDPFTRYAHDACECSTTPGCDPAAIVTALRAGSADVACVTAYADAMETRITCDATPAMPTCEIVPGAAAARYAHAVCACGGDRAGCFANALGEATGSDPACLNERASGYEQDCTGRTNTGCTL